MAKGIPRHHSVTQTAVHRLKIARGHLDKVISMVENGEYCLNIVHQSLAVQAALRQTDRVILKNHMETCVADAIKKGNKNEVIDEVMRVIEKQSN